MRSAFTFLSLAFNLPGIREALLEPNTFLLAVHTAFTDKKWKTGSIRFVLRVCRDWYASGVDEGFEGFDPRPRCSRCSRSPWRPRRWGTAVRRLDPDEGPLHESEAVALESPFGRRSRSAACPSRRSPQDSSSLSSGRTRKTSAA